MYTCLVNCMNTSVVDNYEQRVYIIFIIPLSKYIHQLAGAKMENQTYCAETERLVSNNLFKICLSISLILIISAIVPSIILLLTLLRVVRLYNNVKYMLINMTVAMLIVCILSSIDNIVIVYHAYLMDTPCKLVVRLFRKHSLHKCTHFKTVSFKK